MALRTLSTNSSDDLDLKRFLFENSEFTYAHLVKFEKPNNLSSEDSNSNVSTNFTYITDSQYPITSLGNVYASNKLLKVGDVKESSVPSAGSMAIEVAASAVGTFATIPCNFSDQDEGEVSISTNQMIGDLGFRIGDTVKFTGGPSANNGKEGRIESIRSQGFTLVANTGVIFSETETASDYEMELSSPEIHALLASKDDSTYKGYINSRVEIHKVFMNPETGEVIGDPYLIFKGLITSGSLKDSPKTGAVVKWSLTSHWGDFVRVNGRMTSDEAHRSIGTNGVPAIDSLLAPEYAYDLGFEHAEKAITSAAVYQTAETRYKSKRRGGLAGAFGGRKMVEYQVMVDREVDLRFNLDAKYLPVVYGVNKVEGIPVFADVLDDDPSKVLMAHAICEGEIGGIFDVFIGDESGVCIDKADFDIRGSSQYLTFLEYTYSSTSGDRLRFDSQLTGYIATQLSQATWINTSTDLGGVLPIYTDNPYGALYTSHSTNYTGQRYVHLYEYTTGSAPALSSISFPRTFVDPGEKYYPVGSFVPVYSKSATGADPSLSPNTIEGNSTGGICVGRADRGDVLGSSIGLPDLMLYRSNLSHNVTDSGRRFNYRAGEEDPTRPSAKGISARGSSVGLRTGDSYTFYSPISVEMDFFTGARNQSASNRLTSYSFERNFKIQNDYYNSDSTYWSSAHKLLDTAYAVSEFTVAEGEASIPRIEYLVNGRFVQCFNYDFSYRMYPGQPDNSSSFEVGDTVDLRIPAQSAIVNSNVTITDKFYVLNTLGEQEVRFKFDEKPNISEVATVFFMQKGSITQYFQTSSYTAASRGVNIPIASNSAKIASATGLVTRDWSENTLGAYRFKISTSDESMVQDLVDSFGATNLYFQFRNNEYDTPRVYPQIFKMHEFDTSGAYPFVVTQSQVDLGDLGDALDDDDDLDMCFINVVYSSQGVGNIDGTLSGELLEFKNTASGKTVLKIKDTDVSENAILFDQPLTFNDIVNLNGKTGQLSIIEGSTDVRVTTNPAMHLLDYLTNERYGAGLDLDDDIDLDSFKEAARDCDTPSNITVVTQGYPVVGARYQYAINGRVVWQGTVKSRETVTHKGISYRQAVFTDCIGKLGEQWKDWKNFPANSLIWHEGKAYVKSAAGGITETALKALNNTSSLSLTNLAGGTEYITVGSGNDFVTYEGNPIVRKQAPDTTFTSSGYELYDSDSVKYWKYLGWNDYSQRNVTRHQCNQVVDTSQPLFENIKNMLEQFNGVLRYSAGKYHLSVKGQAAPADTFTSSTGTVTYTPSHISDDDIIGTVSIQDSGVKKTFNSVGTNIVDPAAAFNTRSISFFNSDYLKQDKSIRKQGKIGMPGITNYFNARVHVKQYLDLSRYGLSISFTVGPKYMLLVAGDFIRFSSDIYNFSNKLFRIDSINFKETGLIDITAFEHSDDVYIVDSDSSFTEKTASFDISPTPSGRITAPSGLTATTTKVGTIELSWVNIPGFDPEYMKVNIKYGTSPDRNDEDEWEGLLGTSLTDKFVHEVGNTDEDETYYYYISYQGEYINAKGRKDQLWSYTSPSGNNTGIQGTSLAINANNIDYPAQTGDVVLPSAPIVSLRPEEANANNTGNSLNNGVTIDESAGGIIIDGGGSIKGGQTGYNSGTSGFFLGYDTTTGTQGYKFSIGNPSDSTVNSLTYDGTDIALTGGITATTGSFGGVDIGDNKIYVGAGNFNNSDTGFYLDGTGDFSLSNKLAFDTSTSVLSVNGAITASSLVLDSSIVIAQPNLPVDVYAADTTTKINKDPYFTNAVDDYWFSPDDRSQNVDQRSEISYHTDGVDLPTGRGTYLKIVDNDSSSENIFSDFVDIQSDKTYKVSAWVRQTGGNRNNYLLVDFKDSNGNNINNSSSPVSDGNLWASIGTYHYYFTDQVFPSDWTKYEIVFGSNASTTIPTGAVKFAVGGLFARDPDPQPSGTESTVELAQILVEEFDNSVSNAAVTSLGGVTITPTKLYQGTGTYGNANTGFYLDEDGNFSLKNKLAYNGTTLQVTGTVTADAGSIGGINIANNKIYTGTGTFANSNTGFYIDNTGDFSLSNKLKFDVSASTLTVDGTIEADEFSTIEGKPVPEITVGTKIHSQATLSPRVVIFGGDPVFYAALEDNTRIYLNNELVATVNKGASSTIAASNLDNGDIIHSTKPVSLRQNGSPLPTLAATGQFFATGNRPDYQYLHFGIYSPYADGRIKYFNFNDINPEDANNDSLIDWSDDNAYNASTNPDGWKTQALTQGSVAELTIGRSSSTVTGFQWFQADTPVVISSAGSTSNTWFGGTLQDVKLLKEVSREVLSYDEGTQIKYDPGNTGTIVNTNHGTATSWRYSRSTGDLLFSHSDQGDGDGSDGVQGIPWKMCGDTYVIDHGLRSYQIATIEPSVISAYYWTGTAWTHYKTHDFTDASRESFAAHSEGDSDDHGVDSNSFIGQGVADKPWRFIGTGRFALRVNTPSTGWNTDGYDDDEYFVLGYDSNLRSQETIRVGQLIAEDISADAITGEKILSTTEIKVGPTSGAKVALDGSGTGDSQIRIYAGNATKTEAPFRVTEGGALTATNATISGAITATSLTIGASATISGSIPSTNVDGLATVATSGAASDVSGLATVATSGAASDVSGLGSAATSDTGDFATATQGDTADTALQEFSPGYVILANTALSNAGVESVNYGEAVIVGTNASGEKDTTKNPKIIVDGIAHTFDRSQWTDGSTNYSILTNVANKTGFIVLDVHKTKAFNGYLNNRLDCVFVWKEGDTYYYDKNDSEISFDWKPKAATSLAQGTEYIITATGTTNWTSIGAANSNVGTVFTKNSTTATGDGTASVFFGPTGQSGTILGTATATRLPRLMVIGYMSTGNGGDIITATQAATPTPLGEAAYPGDFKGNLGGVQVTTTKLFEGAGTFNNSNTAFYLDNAGQFSLKNKLSFNGTTLNIEGNVKSGLSSSAAPTGSQKGYYLGADGTAVFGNATKYLRVNSSGDVEISQLDADKITGNVTEMFPFAFGRGHGSSAIDSATGTRKYFEIPMPAPSGGVEKRPVLNAVMTCSTTTNTAMLKVEIRYSRGKNYSYTFPNKLRTESSAYGGLNWEVYDGDITENLTIGGTVRSYDDDITEIFGFYYDDVEDETYVLYDSEDGALSHPNSTTSFAELIFAPGTSLNSNDNWIRPRIGVSGNQTTSSDTLTTERQTVPIQISLPPTTVATTLRIVYYGAGFIYGISGEAGYIK